MNRASAARKTGNSGRLIYEPAGAAREYAPLALNLYAGCPHRCLYCYVPGCLRCSAEEFAARAGKLRSGFTTAYAPSLGRLKNEAAALAATPSPAEILLSFTSDPYQAAEQKVRITHRALEIFAENRLYATILTKHHALDWGLDWKLLLAGRFRLATSVTGLGDAWRDRWEPGCDETGEMRLAALAAARKEGLATWVSLEPVIDPAEALAVLERIGELGAAPHVKIGKLNHHDEWVQGVDWRAFVAAAGALCAKHGLDVYWKESLRPFVS
jgi:DNA repair photolyase